MPESGVRMPIDWLIIYICRLLSDWLIIDKLASDWLANLC